MARSFHILFLLTLAAAVRSQFFGDLLQGLQSYATYQPPHRQIHDQTTRRTKADQTSYHKQTTKNRQTTKAYDSRRSDFSSQLGNWDERQNRRKTSYNNNYTTTKPSRTVSSRRIVTSSKKEQISLDNSNKDYDGKINSISDYYTQKPKYANIATENSNRNNYYTTNNPLVNRPGVRPIVVDDRPPITNRPVTKRPNYGINPRPNDEDSIVFPDDDDENPELTIGPNENSMSAVEKKRYIELAERMCDKYKALGMRAVQAIPLLPSPEPVNLNVSDCTPTTVPLVVGGKVVGIHEFPHMALLGWRKLQEAGYSWKCGGSLVSDQFVLTAAHCSFQDRDTTVVNGPPRAVQLGSSYLDDPGALVVRVASVIRHPEYRHPRSYYDLALVKLVNKVKFSELIKPACLGVPPAVGKPIIATGWGRTEFGGEQSHELRSVSLPVWSMARCREVLGTSRRLPDGPSPDSQLCAGVEQGGKDTCQGDSGGPAQLQEGCTWRVVAVTSLGRSCGAAETPGLYALVHRAFVASQIFADQNYDSSQNYGDNYSQNRNQQRPSTNNNYNNQNYKPQDSVTRRPASSNVNYNNQNYGNDRQDSYNRPQESVTRRPASDNQNFNNQNNDNDRQHSYNRPQQSVTRPTSNNQNYGNDRPDSYNIPQEIATQRPTSNNYNNGQNNYNDRPTSNVNYNRPQNSQNVYDTQRPNGNVADYNSNNDHNNGQNYETDSTNLNYGNKNNRQQNDNINNYSQQPATQRPQFENIDGTQRPNRVSGIINDNNNDYNRQQNSQTEYTTRNPIRSSNVNGGVRGDYANNNRDQSNYNGNNNRRTDHETHTVDKPWWY